MILFIHYQNFLSKISRPKAIKWWSAYSIVKDMQEIFNDHHQPPVSRPRRAYDMGSRRLQGPKVWLAHEKFLIESSHLWMKMSSANVWQSHLCCWQRTDCFAHSLVLVVCRYTACTKRKLFLYYCKIIMLVVQNVFLNVINKYIYLDLIGVQSF